MTGMIAGGRGIGARSNLFSDAGYFVCTMGGGRYLSGGLSGGVMVAQGSLEALVMVRIHAGQPFFLSLFRVVTKER